MRTEALISSFIFVAISVQLLKASDTEQDAGYHFTKLKQKIDDIKTSWRFSAANSSNHNIAKHRSRREVHADDLILNSFASYCRYFNSDPDISKHFEEIVQKQPLSTRDIGGYTRFSQDEELPEGVWDFQAFPVKLLAQKDGQKAWIIFYIAHTGTARVSMLDFQNYQEVLLTVPESPCQKVVSMARFDMNVPVCHSIQSKYKIEQFRVSSKTDSNAIHVYVNVCELLKRKRRLIVTEDVKVPLFRLKSTQSNEFIKGVSLKNVNDSETSFDVEVPLHQDTFLYIDLVLWDWDAHIPLRSSAEIAWTGDAAKPVSIKYGKDGETDNTEQLFSVRVLGDDCDLDTDSFGEQHCIPLKVTINPMQRERVSVSGHVRFQVRPYSYRAMEREVWDAFDVTVPLVRPQNTKRQLPRDLIYFSENTRFRCDEHGNMDHRKAGMGNSCIIQCQAYGKDISHIYISKLEPSSKSKKIKSGSYILPDMASAILNIGSPSDQDDGEYKCTVVTKQGKVKSQSLMVYTRLFTLVNSFYLEEGDTDEARVACDVLGDQSVEIEMYVCGEKICNKTQLDISDRSKYNSSLNETEGYKSLSVFIPWKELKFPRRKLICEAKGDRGSSSAVIHLNYYIQNTLGILPFINSSEFDVVKFKNGSLLATCTITGARPLESWLYLDVAFETDFNELLHKTTTTGNGLEKVTMTRLIPSSDLGYYFYNMYSGNIACRGKNEFGVRKMKLRHASYRPLKKD